MSSHFDYEIASPILSSDLIMISIREDILSKSYCIFQNDMSSNSLDSGICIL